MSSPTTSPATHERKRKKALAINTRKRRCTDQKPYLDDEDEESIVEVTTAAPPTLPEEAQITFDDAEDDDVLCTPRRGSHSGGNFFPLGRTPIMSSSTSFAPPSMPTPMAPLRRSGRRHWIRAIMDDKLESFVEDNVNDLNSDVYSEWLVWDPETWTIDRAESAWIPPILLAARWSSAKTIHALLSTGVWPRARNYLGQNALVALCAQPPASAATSLALRSHFCPEHLRLLHLSSPFAGEMFAADFAVDTTDLETQAARLAALRNQEMGLVAELLLLSGVDPLSPDWSGKNAIDYALAFGHKNILRKLTLSTRQLISANTALEVEAARVEAPYLPLDAIAHTTPPCTPRIPGRRRASDPTSEIISSDEVYRTPVGATLLPTRSSSPFGGDEQTIGPDLSVTSCGSSIPTGAGTRTFHKKRRGSRLQASKIMGSPPPALFPLGQLEEC